MFMEGEQMARRATADRFDCKIWIFQRGNEMINHESLDMV